MTAPAGTVLVWLWRLPGRSLPAALLRLPADRRALAGGPAVRFARLLGTGRGDRFTPTDIAPLRWLLLASFDRPVDAQVFARRSPTVAAWDRLAVERWTLRLSPLTSRGRWAGREPFRPASGRGVQPAGPVAVLTRARLRPGRAVRFWRTVPAVAAELSRAAGLLFAIGVGEAPVGWQGTFSLWASVTAVDRFAYHGRAHAAAVRRTTEVGWYAEELFARFTVEAAAGTVDGADPLAGPATRSSGNLLVSR